MCESAIFIFGKSFKRIDPRPPGGKQLLLIQSGYSDSPAASRASSRSAPDVLSG